MTEVDDQSAAGLNDALDRFTRRVEQVRATLFASPHFCDDVARAEAVRYLKSMEALATTTAMYYSDPRFPRFHNSCAAEWDSKYPNPDTYYLTAKVSGDYDYRITGRLGTAVQTTIGSYAYAKNAHTGAGERATDRSLKTDADGNFTLLLSREPSNEENWLPLIEGATVVTIYQTFGAWEETKGSFTIEAVGAEDALPTHPSTEHVIASLDEAAADVADVIGYWLETRGKREADLQANSMATEPQHIQVAALDTFFSHGRYEIDDDHVVVIDLVAPEDARYFGFTLYNAWAQAMDFMHRQISLNDAEAVPDTDGHHRLVIATRDPGVVNWLDASGHPNGTFNWRVTGPTAPAAPTVRLVPLAELDDVLPQGHPRATPARRAEQLRARRVNMAQRFSS